LWSASKVPIDKIFLVHVVSLLDRHSEFSIDELLRDKASSDEFEQIYRLIFDRRLTTPLHESLLSKNSIVKHSGESYDCYL